jgi:hypothetical protein
MGVQAGSTDDAHHAINRHRICDISTSRQNEKMTEPRLTAGYCKITFRKEPAEAT